MRYTNTGIAAICHEANRGLQLAQGVIPSDPWQSSPLWQQEITIAGVQRARHVITPREHHEAWRAAMAAEGWAYSPELDLIRRHHPNMLPYSQLPDQEKDMDELFLLIVTWAVSKG